MNKRIALLSVLLVLLTAAAVPAQHIPESVFADDAAVGRFYSGCLKIIEGELATDATARNEAYALAMDALNPRRKGMDTGFMKLTAVDTTGLSGTHAVDFAFDYSYARSKYNSTDFSPKGISRGFGRTCRLFDMTLKPGGKASFCESVRDDCLLIAVARPGVKIAATITIGDRIIEADSFENGLVNYAAWQLQEKTQATYTIENLSDTEASIILISN